MPKIKGPQVTAFCIVFSPVSGWEERTETTVTYVFPTTDIPKNGSAGVTACDFAPNGKTIVSASWDTKIKIWDVSSGTCEATLEGHRYLL